MNNYTWLHLHTELSLLDSCTNYKLYVDKAKEFGMTAIAFTEHGNLYNWVAKKIYCDKNSIKYIHGCEVYLTETHEEKIRDNYHTILLAKNYEGVKELNLLVGKSTDEKHMYYKPRISFDEFFNISDNIIKISACLASPIAKYYKKIELEGADVDKINKTYDRLCKSYDYYEIQPHENSKDQIAYNKYLLSLSTKYKKPLIMGTDIHAVNKYKEECRSILQKAKRIQYEDEDSFDLSCKNYNELIDMCRKQDCFSMDIYLEAIENTNIVANMIESFDLDVSFKYPILYENEEEVFKKRIFDMYNYKISKGIIQQDNKYIENIREEFRVFKKIKMIGFMLFMSELMVWCRENDIAVGVARGSVGGSVIAYLTDITDINPIKWDTVFSRFANESRIEIGDIDVDIAPNQRDLVYNYIINRFGEDYTSYILAIGTMADKGTIDEIGRALNYPLSLVSEIKDCFEKNQTVAKEKYPDLFYYFDGMVGTAISQSIHPAGIIASPISLKDNYGCFNSKDGKSVLYINMEEIHDISLVKYDILGLKNVQIIKECCDLIGIKYPLSHEINWEQEEVWKDISNNNIGIFQFEGNYAGELLKKYQCRNILNMSMLNASLRPSGASYRDRLISKEFNKNPSEVIDKLLEKNNGYLIFQEDIIAFLQNICGLSGSEADNVRRAIGRKDKDRLDKAMPSILEGYCSESNKPRHISEKEAKEFLQIIEDSSSYMFGKNHSQAYSMIGYMCGDFRYNYPIEFATAYLNNANNDDDIKMGFELCEYKNIKINNIKFRYSKSNYFPHKQSNSIYKGLSSIKHISESCANGLYSLKDKQYSNFYELVKDVYDNKIANSRQLNILIMLNYFEEFGKIGKLLKIEELYQTYNGKKTFKKDNLTPDIYDLIKKYSDKETAKQFSNVNINMVVDEIISTIKDFDIPTKDKILAEFQYVGYATTTDNCGENICIISNIDDSKSNPILTLYYLAMGVSKNIKIKSKVFKDSGLKLYNLIKIVEISLDRKWIMDGKDVNGKNKYKRGDEKEEILTLFEILA